MRDRRDGRTLPPPVAIFAVASVLVVSLWASGAPSMVYPVYRQRWDVGEVVTSGLFATYPAALIVALIVCGSASDVFGRRRVMMAGLSCIAAGSALFVFADGIAALCTGRILQGLGVGVALSAASAALIELTPSRTRAMATAVNTAATATGTALALLLGGVLVQYSTSPTRAPFIILLAVVSALIPLMWFLPEMRAQSSSRWRPTPVRVPASNRCSFVAGTATLTVAFMMGAVFIALGAQIINDLIGTRNAFVAALALVAWAITIVPASLVARAGSPRSASAYGGALSVLGSTALIAAANRDSLALFLLAAVLCGFGYGLMFSGGLATVAENTEIATRASTLSAMYLVAYLAQGATALGIGALASAHGLSAAMLVTMPTVATLSALTGATALLSVSARPRRGARTNDNP